MVVDFSGPVSRMWVSCRMLEGGQSDTVLKQNQNSCYILPNILLFQCLFQGIVFDSTHSNFLFSSHSQSVFTPRGSLCFVSKLCVGHLCVWRDVRVLRASCNLVRGMHIGCSKKKTPQIPTFSLCFGYIFLNGGFLSFWRLGRGGGGGGGGGYLTLPFREL